jgi:hypothetical protein
VNANSIQLVSDTAAYTHILLDKTASRRKLLEDFRWFISRFASRNPKVSEAVDLMLKHPNWGAVRASKAVDAPELARQVRYWHGKVTGAEKI